MRVATVPTVYGIETIKNFYFMFSSVIHNVATVPTVYGIETVNLFPDSMLRPVTKLQQYLPFTVLKPTLSPGLIR